MLYNPKAQRSASVTSLAPRAMSGRRLNRLVKKGSPRDRANLALDLERGAVQLIRTTRAQAAALTKASTGYIGTLARLSEDERRPSVAVCIMLDHSCQVQRRLLAERSDDLYETPTVAVEALLREERLPHRLWEPACGRGAIVRPLRAAGH